MLCLWNASELKLRAIARGREWAPAVMHFHKSDNASELKLRAIARGREWAPAVMHFHKSELNPGQGIYYRFHILLSSNYNAMFMKCQWT